MSPDRIYSVTFKQTGRKQRFVHYISISVQWRRLDVDNLVSVPGQCECCLWFYSSANSKAEQCGNKTQGPPDSPGLLEHSCAFKALPVGVLEIIGPRNAVRKPGRVLGDLL